MASTIHSMEEIIHIEIILAIRACSAFIPAPGQCIEINHESTVLTISLKQYFLAIIVGFDNII